MAIIRLPLVNALECLGTMLHELAELECLFYNTDEVRLIGDDNVNIIENYIKGLELVINNSILDLIKYPDTSKDNVRTCRVCGCTDNDCTQCAERTGKPCYWVDDDLCSACVEKEEV